MTIALPGRHAPPTAELALAFETSVVLLTGRAWLDLRHDAGDWYGSLRLYRPGDKGGVSAFTDGWRGPYASRQAALSNAYLFGKREALAAHCAVASQLPARVWDLISLRS